MTESGAAIIVGMIVGCGWFLHSTSDNYEEEARALELLEFQVRACPGTKPPDRRRENLRCGLRPWLRP